MVYAASAMLPGTVVQGSVKSFCSMEPTWPDRLLTSGRRARLFANLLVAPSPAGKRKCYHVIVFLDAVNCATERLQNLFQPDAAGGEKPKSPNRFAPPELQS
jgi:hypothetical protein